MVFFSDAEGPKLLHFWDRRRKGEEKEKKRRRRGEEKGDVIAERTELVFKAIPENSDITLSMLTELLHISKKQAEPAIKKLKEANRIHRDGSDRNGKWIVGWYAFTAYKWSSLLSKKTNAAETYIRTACHA